MTGPSAAAGRLWRGYADVRRVLARQGSGRTAVKVFGDVARSDADRWNTTLADRHDAYRSAVEPPNDPVAIICVSTRAHLLPTVVRDVASQSHPNTELVLVTNGAAYAEADIDGALAPLDAASIPYSVIHRPPETSLGSCLNVGMDATSARFIAKFDDDDRYGPDYLVDALRAHAYAGAGVVGKHTYYAHLEQDDRTVLRFPTNEFRYSSTLAGGTLVLDRRRVGGLRFADISLGEDRAFIASCHRQGISTFSADRFNFLQTRSTDNTWVTTTDDFTRRTVAVGAGMRLSEVNR